MKEFDSEQAFEWIKTGRWSYKEFEEWLDANNKYAVGYDEGYSNGYGDGREDADNERT